MCLWMCTWLIECFLEYIQYVRCVSKYAYVMIARSYEVVFDLRNNNCQLMHQDIATTHITTNYKLSAQNTKRRAEIGVLILLLLLLLC